MKPKEKAEFIMSLCRPRKVRKQGPLAHAMVEILGGQKPNREKGTHARTSDAFGRLNEDIHYLSGFLTLLPSLGLRRGTQLREDGQNLLTEAYTFLLNCKPSVASIRKMRKFGERIAGFIEKVEKEFSAGT